MEIGSSMASAVALSQGQARQEFGMAALAREAQSETSVANMVEKSVKDGNGQGQGTVTDTRGQNYNLSV